MGFDRGFVLRERNSIQFVSKRLCRVILDMTSGISFFQRLPGALGFSDVYNPETLMPKDISVAALLGTLCLRRR